MSTDDRIAFGVRLARLRGEAGLTQEQLGKGLDVDGSDIGKGAISAWEVGRTIPSAALLPKLCQRLHCTADRLLGLTPPREKARA
jgi:transcriptional regulator with XRE-family HTH domain